MKSDQKYAVTVDVVIFAIEQGQLKVLLIKRKIEPFLGKWAIPGGFVLPFESLEQAARRELIEETGVDPVYLEQLYTFGQPERDPRGRVITVVYYSLLPGVSKTVAGSDASESEWISLKEVKDLAFDHSEILSYALSRLRGKIEYTDLAFHFLEKSFTLSQLQEVYEAVLDKKLDKRNFRKKMELSENLKPLKKFGPQTKGRPAQIYAYRHGKQKLSL